MVSRDPDFVSKLATEVLSDNAIAEFVDKLRDGHFEFFVCRVESCKCFFPAVMWIEKGGHYRCPSCFAWYRPGASSLEGHTLVPAQKILVMKFENLTTAIPSGSAAASAAGKADEEDEGGENDLTCMKRNGFHFWLCEWQDSITQGLIDKLKLTASGVREQIKEKKSVEFSIEEVKKIQQGVKQPEFFEKLIISEEIRKRVQRENQTIIGNYAGHGELPTFWSYKHLPKDEQQNFFTYMCRYEYTPGETNVLTQIDQIRVWAHTAFLNAALAKLRAVAR